MTRDEACRRAAATYPFVRSTSRPWGRPITGQLGGESSPLHFAPVGSTMTTIDKQIERILALQSLLTRDGAFAASVTIEKSTEGYLATTFTVEGDHQPTMREALTSLAGMMRGHVEVALEKSKVDVDKLSSAIATLAREE